MLADIFRVMANQTVAFANRAVLHLAGGGDFEAFLHTALGLQLGHFGLLYIESVASQHGSPISQLCSIGTTRIAGFVGNARVCKLQHSTALEQGADSLLKSRSLIL